MATSVKAATTRKVPAGRIPVPADLAPALREFGIQPTAKPTRRWVRLALWGGGSTVATVASYLLGRYW